MRTTLQKRRYRSSSGCNMEKQTKHIDHQAYCCVSNVLYKMPFISCRSKQTTNSSYTYMPTVNCTIIRPNQCAIFVSEINCTGNEVRIFKKCITK